MDDEQYKAIMAERGLAVKGTKPRVNRPVGQTFTPMTQTDKLTELYSLAEKKHVLDENGLNNLKNAVNSFTESEGEPPNIEKVIQYIHSIAFQEGVLEAIRILQKR